MRTSKSKISTRETYTPEEFNEVKNVSNIAKVLESESLSSVKESADPLQKALDEIGMADNVSKEDYIKDGGDTSSLIVKAYCDIKNSLELTYYAANGERRISIDKLEGLDFDKAKRSKKRNSFFSFILVMVFTVSIVGYSVMAITGVVDVSWLKEILWSAYNWVTNLLNNLKTSVEELAIFIK